MKKKKRVALSMHDASLQMAYETKQSGQRIHLSFSSIYCKPQELATRERPDKECLDLRKGVV